MDPFETIKQISKPAMINANLEYRAADLEKKVRSMFNVISNISIHHTGSSKMEPADIHTKHRMLKFVGASYHFYVRKNGDILEMLPTKYITEITGSAYQHTTISVCFEGDFNTEVMQSGQFTKGVQLVSYLIYLHSLKLSAIKKYRDMAASTKSPGEIFPWDSLATSVKNATGASGTTSTGSSSYGVYYVVSGDTFGGIAKKFGMTMDALKKLNTQIADYNKISVGQKIYYVQSKSSADTTTTGQSTQAGGYADSTSKSTDIANEASVVVNTSTEITASGTASTIANVYDRNSSYPEYEFSLPGYSKARILIKTNSTGSTVSIPFLVSPDNVSDSRSNALRTIKTEAGWFIARVGQNIGQLNFSGFMLDSREQMERHAFIEAYKKNVVDKMTDTFDSAGTTVYVDIEGSRYVGFINSVTFQKSSLQPFLYQYSISFLYLSDAPSHGLGTLLDGNYHYAEVLADGTTLSDNTYSMLTSTTAKTYVVKSGDTLGAIASAHNIPLSTLIALNKTNIPNPDKISPGMVVKLS